MFLFECISFVVRFDLPQRHSGDVMNFHVGQKVVCVDSGAAADGVVMPLVKGCIYTVTGLKMASNGLGVFLAEVAPPERPGFSPTFRVSRFRPIVEKKTDISIFTAMLNPSKRSVDA
jgi:hypothetical protein